MESAGAGACGRSDNQAIRAAALFAETNLRDDEVMQVRCLDGFVASVSKERIMRTGPGQSIAYVAIENPKSKWPDPPLNPPSGSAGPFYLVWLKPELSGRAEGGLERAESPANLQTQHETLDPILPR